METDETYLGGFVSVYLSKGGSWKALWGLPIPVGSRSLLGVYATTDRIIGIEVGWHNFVISYVPLLIATGFYLAAFYLFHGVQASILLLLLLAVFVPPLTILSGILLSIVVEERLKRKRPLTIEEVERENYFEASRGDISGVIMKAPAAFTHGSLTIKLRQGQAIEVIIFRSFGPNESCFDRLMDLMESFCAKPFVFRFPDMLVGTLQSQSMPKGTNVPQPRL